MRFAWRWLLYVALISAPAAAFSAPDNTPPAAPDNASQVAAASAPPTVPNNTTQVVPARPPLTPAQKIYLAELVAKAKQLKLSDSFVWHKLVHYISNLVMPGYHGMVDSPQFYVAPNGKYDPEAELEATLASFFSPATETPTSQNPQCMFIARYTWLKQQLDFDPKRMPEHRCQRFHNWYKALNPGGMTLVFASAYLNNPSSMYGHPLLRVDAKDQNKNTRLLAYSISFAADTDESNGLMFAIKGLFGGYPGEYSILPYYVKVREYSSIENRDLWEYQLTFTPKEMDRILMNAWELGPNYYRYFFFDENCAYHLLDLLQVARPKMDLAGPFRWWAIPSDAVREVDEQPGLVKKVVYRPSRATITRNDLAHLSDNERDLVMQLTTGKIATDAPSLQALPAPRQAAVLETTLDYAGYLKAAGKPKVADTGALERNLLIARSKLDVPKQTPDVPTPAYNPAQGHGSSRATVGAGSRGGQAFQQFSTRATYHDLMDDDRGFTRGAQIEFFRAVFRHYDHYGTRLENFIPVEIMSLAPQDEFFNNMSWHISAQWKRLRVADGAQRLAFSLDGGPGAAWSNESNTALWYMFFENSARIGKPLYKGYSLGVGLRMGVYYDVTPRWRVHPYIKGMRYFSGQMETPFSAGLQQRVTLGQNLALRIDLSRNRQLHWQYNSGMASMLFYF